MIYKEEKLPEKYIKFNNFYSTDYDYLFENKIKRRGLSYYNNGKIENLVYKNNTYSADVIGAKVYKVKLKIENNVLTEISCTCPYHNDTNKYCKHVYALLLAVKMQKERIELIKYINKYKSNISYLIKKMDDIIESNVKLLYSYEVEWFKERELNYKKTIKSFQENEKLKDFELYNILRELNYFFNMLCNDLNELNERIENNKQELEKRRQEEKNHHIDTFTYTTDESQIFDAIDHNLSDIDLKTLYQIKEKLESTNDDTELIDKAIVNRKKKNLIEKEQLKKLRKQEKIESHLSFGEKLFGVLLGLFSNKKNKKAKRMDYLMPWEQEEVNKGNYDSWNFEEEELEDDDYYSEDD